MAYLLLAGAIIGELIGTTLLKYSDGFTKFLPSVSSLLSYGICFFLFSKALKDLNLSVAYATWCGLGVVAATLISVIIFKEGINFLGILGVVLVLAGVVLLNLFGSAH